MRFVGVVGRLGLVGDQAGRMRLSMQDACKTPRKTRRYGMDRRLRRALKTQPLSTRRYPLEPPFSGSSPVAPTIESQSPYCALTSVV
jgi:hypothetical protein